jgi:hypothetical protein
MKQPTTHETISNPGLKIRLPSWATGTENYSETMDYIMHHEATHDPEIFILYGEGVG